MNEDNRINHKNELKISFCKQEDMNRLERGTEHLKKELKVFNERKSSIEGSFFVIDIFWLKTNITLNV